MPPCHILHLYQSWAWTTTVKPPNEISRVATADKRNPALGKAFLLKHARSGSKSRKGPMDFGACGSRAQHLGSIWVWDQHYGISLEPELQFKSALSFALGATGSKEKQTWLRQLVWVVGSPSCVSVYPSEQQVIRIGLEAPNAILFSCYIILLFWKRQPQWTSSDRCPAVHILLCGCRINLNNVNETEVCASEKSGTFI